MIAPPSPLAPFAQGDQSIVARGWVSRLGHVLALFSVALSVFVFARRGVVAWQAAQVSPGVAVTSGFEEESHFALWRAVHGHAVYLDISRPPFASAYFNWLFYSTYAWPLRSIVSATTDQSILIAGRWVTALGAIAGLLTLLFLLCKILNGNLAFAGALASAVFFGPLVGWWAHTVRPDVWALSFETAGAALLLYWFHPRPWLSTFASMLLFFAAWSCKQTYVCGLVTTVLFMASHRRWSHALIFVGSTLIAWSITQYALGPIYRSTQLDTAAASVFNLASGFDQTRSAMEKSVPLLWLVLAAFSLGPVKSNPPRLARDAVRFGLIGLAATTPLVFAASCKVGSSTNYFFSTTLLLVIAGAGAFALKSRMALQATVCAIAIALQCLVLSHAGGITLGTQVQSLAGRWKIYSALPEPRFTSCAPLQLPWLNPSSPPLVLAFTYESELSRGKKFEGGGVGGLIDSGYFASLMLPSNTDGVFLGGSLSKYERRNDIDGLTVYVRHSR